MPAVGRAGRTCPSGCDAADCCTGRCGTPTPSATTGGSWSPPGSVVRTRSWSLTKPRAGRPLGRQRDHLVLDSGRPALTLTHDLRLEAAVTVTGAPRSAPDRPRQHCHQVLLLVQELHRSSYSPRRRRVRRRRPTAALTAGPPVSPRTPAGPRAAGAGSGGRTARIGRCRWLGWPAQTWSATAAGSHASPGPACKSRPRAQSTPLRRPRQPASTAPASVSSTSSSRVA